MNNAKERKVQNSEMKVEDLDHVDRGLVEKLLKGGYSRRDVLKLSVATGVSVAAADNLLFSGNVARASTPKKGGSARMAAPLHGPDDHLDPVLGSSTIDASRFRATYNGLIQHSESLEPLPDLAESFEANSNATEWNFKIKKGVEFHDGSKLTADDVVYSMNRHLGEDSISVIKSALASIKEWKKLGTYEVKAILNTPNSDLPTILGLNQTKVVKNGTTGDGIGTGPYVLEFFEPGVRSIHKRNENYFRDGGNLDVIEMTGITDPIARVNALVAGDVQLAATIDPKAFRQVEESDTARLLSIPAALQVGICCLKNTLPGSNDDFVKGMQYIQDRERIVKSFFKGRGSVGNDTSISAAHGVDFCSELPQREYDPEKAKFHFNKSGIESAELYVAPVATAIEDISLLTQANCAKIGFDLKLRKVPSDGYWGNVWMKEPLNVVGWNMRPTANSQIALQFGPGGPWNDTYWNNDRMGELVNSSLAETDPDKRHAMYCEMQMLIHNNSGMVIPAFSNVNDGVASNLMGVPRNPLGELGASEWPEFVWLA
jgi:peptide/nickel transport system substrate-binding protein